MDLAGPFPEDGIGLSTNLDQSIWMARKHIADGYMVEAHQTYLQALLEIKAKEPNYADGEPPGLSENVYKRIWCLKQPIPTESKNCVPESCKINVKAVLKAYRSGKLEVKPGFVSYWVDGVQISGLVPDDIKECAWIAENYVSQGRAFWTEKPAIGRQMVALSIPPFNPAHQHNVWLSVRHRNSQNFTPLKFLKDTGASLSSILDSDLLLLDQLGRTRVFHRFELIQTAAGVVQRPVYGVYVKMLGQNCQNAPDLQAILGLQPTYLGQAEMALQVVVNPDVAVGGTRLLGPFMREYFFTGSAPDGQGNLVISTNKLV